MLPSPAPAVVVAALLLSSCSSEHPLPERSSKRVSANEAWALKGSEDERFVRLARQLRGLDVAMIEVAHRYGELHSAGEDANWQYASYQLRELRKAITTALERRPKRATSAAMLEPALGALDQAVRAQDPALFASRYQALTATCNACHHAEKVGFIHVRPPTVRTSVVGVPPPSSAAR